MFDIKFFQAVEPLKKRILSGGVTYEDVSGVERELERFRARYPTVFNIETTNYCNMTCIMCPRTTLMQRENQWVDDDLFANVLDQITPHPSEDLEQFWTFIQDVYGISFNQRTENAFYFYVVSHCVILHGYGEPLVDKNIVSRVQACTDRGIPTYFSCVPANIRVDRADRVMSAGLNFLKFSIDSLDEQGQKRIRGHRNNFQKSYETILEVLEVKEKKGHKTIIVPTMISFSQDSEADEMHEEFLDLWKDLDVFAYIKSQDNRWYFEEDDDLTNRSHYASQYCEYPWTSATVMADGSVVPCTQDYDCEMVMGNCKEEPLKEIWNGKQYQELRHWHASGQFPVGHKCVDRCDQVKLFQCLKKN